MMRALRALHDPQRLELDPTVILKWDNYSTDPYDNKDVEILQAAWARRDQMEF
jgi:hypothetical protein